MLTHLQRIQKLRQHFKVPKDKIGPEAFRDLGFINILELKLSDEQYDIFHLQLTQKCNRPISASVDDRQESLCRTLFPEEYINEIVG